MFENLMQKLFLRTDGFAGAVAADADGGLMCHRDHSAVIEHVVDELYSRLRMAPDCARVLTEPVATTLSYIDAVAESVPGPLLCSRSTFADDLSVNALFVNPAHVQEVFSASEDVRELFEANPLADDCWGLLCMHMQERTQPGMALVDDKVQRDVMQTSVSFSDHQLVSPGTDESSARCALKCCMFDALLSHIRREAAAARAHAEDLQSQLQALKARQRRASPRGAADGNVEALRGQIADVEQQLGERKPGLNTLSGYLEFVSGVLSRPAEFFSIERHSLCLSRQAVKLDCGSAENGDGLEFSEIRIASHPPRIGVLVRFPRDELLPRPDMLKRADLFLIV